MADNVDAGAEVDPVAKNVEDEPDTKAGDGEPAGPQSTVCQSGMDSLDSNLTR